MIFMSDSSGGMQIMSVVYRMSFLVCRSIVSNRDLKSFETANLLSTLPRLSTKGLGIDLATVRLVLARNIS
jgi:hypothetical protein